ncbi:MAG: hypothetical protein OXE78_04570 [Gammaproteobacteria bacterium]|nr:hypothetical protein [Gammaproteobacteria bacterium]
MKQLLTTTMLLVAGWVLPLNAQDTDSITGLIMDEGWETVRTNCISCHSAQLITSNFGNRAVWKSRILWMQDTQGLPQLSPATEEIILAYLAAHYGPKEATRRATLPPALMPDNPYRTLD